MLISYTFSIITGAFAFVSVMFMLRYKSEKQNTTKLLKEKAELSFITSAPATSTQEPNERTIFKRLEKQTNVHIDWTCFVADQFSDKKNLALAQFGNLPDGLFNAGMSDYDLLRYAKQGIIIPLENLIDKYMPNLQAVFEKYPEYRTMCTAPDGHIYSFPWIEQLGAGKEAIQAIGDIPYINKKWLDYLGLDIPTTTDELEQVLIAFRDHADDLKKQFDIEGDVIPMSFIINNGDQDPAILINGFGEGYGDTGDHFAVKDDGTVIYTTVQEGYKEGIEWLHKLVTEDLVDPEAFTKIVSNLLTNALKFTVSHIWIDLIPTEENKLELRIKDNGQGIAVEEQEKIFTPFYQIRENRPTDNIGTGVGLLLVKKLVSLMHGELKLESELGLGATFIIWFDRSEQGETLQDEARQTVILPQAPIDVTEQKPYHILVVDDNQDLLNYLRMLLAPRYQITCASNGKEALDLLSELMPDLVISDVMMPVMDGMELCRKIKQNFRTSHLPVVLLTAKVETGDYVEGLENGADLYVAKPFSSDIIKAQIHSLLSNRERMKGSFKTEPMLPSASVASSRIDKEFLEKVTGIIESRMIDSDFSVDVLAQEIGISRTGLFTKLKAVSGMTPNDFIRIIRLDRKSVV